LINYSVDISHYQGSIDLDILYENGVKTIIAKSSSGCNKDVSFDNHATKITKDGRFKFGIYHWCDPIVNSLKQSNFCMETIKPYKIDFVCPDIEQWWSDWTKWYRWMQGKLNYNKVPKAGGQKMSDSGKTFCDVAIKTYKQDQINVYSNPDTIKNRSPQLQSWHGSFGTWLATYPRFPDVSTWNDYRTYCEPLMLKMEKPYAKGMTKLVRWQFGGDQWALPGTYSDFNCKHPSNIDLNIELDSGVVIDPIVVIPEEKQEFLYEAIVTADYLYKRTLANSNAPNSGYLQKNDKVKVYANDALWSQISVNPILWAGSKYLKKI
jgi:hypothetical protein